MKILTGSQIIDVAEKEVGYHEGKNKDNKYGRWYGINNDKWCMEFVQWVYHVAGHDLPLKTASCGGLLRLYKRNAPQCISKNPIAGCVVIFDWPKTSSDTDHTGIFVSKTDTTITTIDGNTSDESNSNGGYVMIKTRPLSYANPVYIIPDFLEEEEMPKRYNTLKEISDDLSVCYAVETVSKLIEKKAIRGQGKVDKNGKPADMELSEDMLRLLVYNDRMGLYD